MHRETRRGRILVSHLSRDETAAKMGHPGSLVLIRSAVGFTEKPAAARPRYPSSPIAAAAAALSAEQSTRSRAPAPASPAWDRTHVPECRNLPASQAASGSNSS